MSVGIVSVLPGELNESLFQCAMRAEKRKRQAAVGPSSLLHRFDSPILAVWVSLFRVKTLFSVAGVADIADVLHLLHG
jgi:hypothetical protein